MLAATMILMGQQSLTPNLPARANGPGFAVLAEARQLKEEEKYAEAIDKALKASRIFQQQSDWISWGDCYEEAYLCARKSESSAIYNALLPELREASNTMMAQKNIPDKTQAVIWMKTASTYHFLGEYDQAFLLYEKALPFAERAGNADFLMRLYENLAIVIWTKGDDYRALNYHEKALSLAIAQKDTPFLAIINTNLGNTWRIISPPKSIQFYQKALDLKPNDAQTLMLLSKSYLDIETNFNKALETALAALQFSDANEQKSDVLHQIGQVYYEMKKYNLALAYYDKAIKFSLLSYGKNHPECTKIHVYKGNALLAKKSFKEALIEYNHTLSDLLPLFLPVNEDQNPKEPELTSSSLWILEALLGKAGVYEKSFSESHHNEDLVRSLECAELALHFQDKVKLQYVEEESKFAANEYLSSATETALRSAFQLYQLTHKPEYALRAFSISEQTKAVVLAESLYKKEMKRIAKVPPALLEQERQHAEQIAYFEEKLSEDEAKTSQASYKDSLFQARRSMELLNRQILDEYPEYGQALFNYRSDISPDSVRQHLPKDVALVEYFLGDSSLFTFALTRDTFWAQEQKLPSTFSQTATKFLRTVNDWRFVSDSSALASQIFLENSHQLYQLLLEKPLAVTQAKRLFIVPDGQLNLLPFELLLTQSYAGQWIDRDVPFLIKDRAVSYRFSSRKQMGNSSRPTEGWGGFGLEYDEKTLSFVNNPVGHGSYTGLRDFGQLPYAGREIKAVSGTLGGAFWLNQDATRENFLKNAERYGILHLAMHGQVDEHNPLRSRLVFSCGVTNEDPSVYASDLYNLQLHAGLSVLSACRSGTGTWKRGEGVMSLARAFAFAGCPSVVMSLWNVSDQSTSDLMVSFYEQLKKGVNKDEALRSAKLDYLKTVSAEYAKPIYWAAFVPIGEMDGLSDRYFSGGKSGLYWYYWGALMLGLAGLAVWWRRRYFKK
jgi:CHAT domain-containing protein